MRLTRDAFSKALMVTTAAVGLGFLAIGPASAGNIFLTGHDTDFHGQTAILAADLTYARNGSALPVLVLDAGSELSNLAKSAIGAGNVVTIAPSAVTAADFNAAIYSAFAVASESSCGGCDNSPADNAKIASFGTAIAAFVTAGGGIVGLAGASDPLAYAYVPTAATNAGGSPPSSGYVETAAGALAGLLPENGDPTHNFFSTPGTAGLSSAFSIAETVGIGGPVESVFISGASIGCTGPSCVITGSVPELSTWGMMLLGFAGLGFLGYRKSRRQSAMIAA
jgi:hypothetical protein